MSATPRAFSATSIALHWLVAVGIVGMIGFGVWVGAMESGPDKTAAIQIHKSCGVLVGALALLRLVWRSREGFPPAAAHAPSWETRVARRVHEAMLLLTVAIPVTGMLKSVTYARPVEVFGAPLIPKLLAEKNVPWNEAVSLAHSTFAYLLAAIIVLHVGAAVKHHVVDGDGMLWRMIKPVAR